MAFITLTTDWITTDYYAGAVKGAIVSLNPQVGILDISHQITPFNIAQASFVLRNSFSYFPKGTVHLVDVCSEETAANRHVAVSYHGHYFVGTDNGVFSLVCREKPEMVVHIVSPDEQTVRSFPSLNVFAPVAAYLSMGHPIDELGDNLNDINRHTPLRATYDDSSILGSVVYIDSYHNVITNISKELFDNIRNGRRFDILTQSNRNRISRLNKTYGDTSEGELLALFNSCNLLELAINRGNMAELLSIGIGAAVRVKFYD